jgi:ribosome maturation factor RimP
LTDIAAITRLIEPAVRELGFDLVRVAMVGGTSDPTLQVMAERRDTRQLNLDDCQAISRKLSDLLDELEAAGKDPIEGGYRLEVSSPGIDRPLTRLQDFADWAGHEARVELDEPFLGQKQFRGEIYGISPRGDASAVGIYRPDGTISFLPFSSIKKAKLLLTDKLINATAPLSSEGADIIKTEG